MYYGIFGKGLIPLLTFQMHLPNPEDCYSGLRRRRTWDGPLFQRRIQRVPAYRMPSKNANRTKGYLVIQENEFTVSRTLWFPVHLFLAGDNR